MRPNQNRRMRGRNRNNGGNKGPNPLTRSYESNGPDVKIRGTAQNVADKYAQLARDAQSSGDPVAAENYFQHAEHYYRIIAAAQEQYRQQYGAPQRNGFDDDEDGDEGDGAPNGYGHPPAHGQDYGDDYAEPVQSTRNAYQDGRQDRDARGDRGARQDGRQDARPNRFNERFDRRDRFQNRDQQGAPNGNRQDYARQDGPRQDGPRQESFRQDGPRQDSARQDGFRQDGARQEAPRHDSPRQETPRFEGGQSESHRGGSVNGAEAYARPEPRRERRREEAPADTDATGGLPAFLTAPVRSTAPTEVPATEPVLAEGEEGAPVAARPRRRRRPRFEGTEGAPTGDLLTTDGSGTE